jgi:hypothetical protein
MAEINDIIENTNSAALFLWWQWALIGIAFLLALLIILIAIRRSLKTAKQESLSCLDFALSQLALLEIQNTNSNALAVDLSIIVRKFLRCAFNDNALFETAEEFHTRSVELDRLPANAQNTLKLYLVKLTDHKYAPNPNHPAALENLIGQATSLIKELDSIASSQSLTNSTVS